MNKRTLSFDIFFFFSFAFDVPLFLIRIYDKKSSSIVFGGFMLKRLGCMDLFFPLKYSVNIYKMDLSKKYFMSGILVARQNFQSWVSNILGLGLGFKYSTFCFFANLTSF